MQASLIVSALIGLALLLAGRRLFWVFVGAAGFISGLTLAPRLFPNQPEIIVLAIALGLGVLGAMLAFVLQKLALGIAGALVGGYLLAELGRSWGFGPGAGEVVLYVIGGLFGAVLVITLFDWALIVLSALTGAYLMIHPFGLVRGLETVLFLVTAALGIAVQTGLFLRSRDRTVSRGHVY